MHFRVVPLQIMKKTYLIIGALALAGIGAYALNACNTNKSAKNNGDEPVDLANAQTASSEQEGGTITTAEFDKIIADKKLSMVDFYTTWCGPCKRMAPSVIKIKNEMASTVNVMQIDAEAQADLSARYRIEAYPTLIFFKKGQVVGNVVGLQTYDQIVEVINKLK